MSAPVAESTVPTARVRLAPDPDSDSVLPTVNVPDTKSTVPLIAETRPTVTLALLRKTPPLLTESAFAPVPLMTSGASAL